MNVMWHEVMMNVIWRGHWHQQPANPAADPTCTCQSKWIKKVKVQNN